MLSVLAAFAVAASFPLPSLDGKGLATVPDQKVFRLPSRFERIRDFYTQEFKGQADVTLKAEGTAGQRALIITSRRKGDTWKKATVKEGALETVVSSRDSVRSEGILDAGERGQRRLVDGQRLEGAQSGDARHAGARRRGVGARSGLRARSATSRRCARWTAEWLEVVHANAAGGRARGVQEAGGGLRRGR